MHLSEGQSKRIQNYILNYNDVLGKGNFSTVYRAFDEVTCKKISFTIEQKVAIKVVQLASLRTTKLE